MATTRIPPAGDGYYAAAKARDERWLRELADKYRHDGSITAEERQELRDQVLRLRRRLGEDG